MNDSLYNPDSMSKEDIKTLFVARQPLLDELVSNIKNQPTDAGVQHFLIIAPRGMGKTTMLLMLQFAVEDDKNLSKNWQAIRFPEESYGITELADFWLKVLEYLVEATNDKDFEAKIEEIERRFTNSEDLREAAWALVKDWSKKHKKRILLLVDNFDMILDQIGNDTEQARLRDILMNDGTIMFIGGAPSYFHQIQNYEQPLYNFFKIHNLNDLKFPDIEDLIRRRAEIDEIPNIEELLRTNRSRIKALETFTGGNPRLVLMLYRIITSSDMTEVTKGLESLLDAVTPLYKDKTEKLPTQQKKIINEIAQYSLEKREGISPTEIANRIRMTPNQVSSQLKRLAENGYVRSLNIRGRSSFYVLSEPLYAIWAQMRFGRNAREKRNWLVQILKAIYDVQEIQKEIEKLGKRVGKFKIDGHENKVRGTLEYMVCLLETHPSLMEKNFELAIDSYLDLKEISSLKKEVRVERLINLPEETLEKLTAKGVINKLHTLEMAIHKIKNFFNDLQSEIENGDHVEVLEKLKKITIGFKKLADDLETEANGGEDISGGAIMLSVFGVFIADIFLKLEKFDLAILEYDKSIEHLMKVNLPLNIEIEDMIFSLYLVKIDILLFQDKQNEVIKTFKEYVNLLREKKGENWVEFAMVNLANVLALKDTKGLSRATIREIIYVAKLNEEFLPLIRAIDYLEIEDETLIEKLSPEVRIVVDEMIKTLQMVSEEDSESETNQKEKNKKDKADEKSKSN